MASVVGKLKSDLEALGEYVVMANISSGWFAVFPRTWRTRSEAAKLSEREGPNLIVYRTNSGDPRDHYAIPYPIVRELLSDDTITRSEVNGSERWNLTLKSGGLHVTHRPGRVDVREYYGAPLILENTHIRAPRKVPMFVVDDRTARSVLEGIARETRVIAKSRSRRLRESALRRSKGICEACGIDFSSLFAGEGLHALQVHHKQQLALDDVPRLTSEAFGLKPTSGGGDRIAVWRTSTRS
jgi:hypothetical protein